MALPDFVREKLTQWGLSEYIQKFEDDHIDKDTFLSLGDLGRLTCLIPKIGPRIKFKNRLREYLQWNSMEMCDFVRDKLTEWDLTELVERFEDQGVDRETFLSLEESGSINILIPKIGPRVKFRKRLRDHLKGLETHPVDILEVDMDTNSEIEEDIPEVEPSIFPWPFMWESVSTSGTGGGNSGNEMSEEPIYSGSTVTRAKGLLAVLLFIMRHLTAAVQTDLMALLNFLLPDLVNALKTPVISDTSPRIFIEFYCQNCQFYMGKDPNDGFCCHCGEVFNKERSTQNGSFFLFASLKDLLSNLLKDPGTELLPKRRHIREHDIKDVMDGIKYQNLLKEGELGADDLTLTWNCDGVPIFGSYAYSVWPIQFTIHELPYSQRKDNVIVAGLWFGTEKPKMNTFLKPFVDECCGLTQSPLHWRDSNGKDHASKVFSLVCSSDAVARPLLRNCKQFNGEYGCDWCLHPGTMVKKGSGSTRSYPFDEEKQTARSDKHFKDRQAENSMARYGVKGWSELSKLPLFDIVFGFVPDYLHSVLVGVFRQLMSLWLDPVNSVKPWYVGQQVSAMDSCLLRLKPPSEIARAPRSLKCRESWKAWDWRAFLLFYGIRILPGVLNPAFLEHYFHLWLSIHILLQESISTSDLELARVYLKHFVVNMEILYGVENVSFNCHQLIHLTESVKNWGPLWATSAFSFERNNGYLRALLSDTTCDPQHIYQKFLVWQHIPTHLSSLVFNRRSPFSELLANLSPNNGWVSNNPQGKSCPLNTESLTESMNIAVNKLLNRPVLVEALDSVTDGNTVYYCKSCKETDCVVELHNGCCGEIQLMLLVKEDCVCASDCSCQTVLIIVVHLYDIKPDTLLSKISPENTSKVTVKKVEKTDQCKAFFFKDIRCKCMYVDGWLVPLPNTCERY